MEKCMDVGIIAGGVVSGVVVTFILIGFVVIAIVVDRVRFARRLKQSTTNRDPPDSIDVAGSSTHHLGSNGVESSNIGDGEEQPFYHIAGEMRITNVGDRDDQSTYLYVTDERVNVVPRTRSLKLDGHERRSSLQFWRRSQVDSHQFDDTRVSRSMRRTSTDDGDVHRKRRPWSIKGAVQVMFPGMLKALPQRYGLQETLLKSDDTKEDTENGQIDLALDRSEGETLQPIGDTTLRKLSSGYDDIFSHNEMHYMVDRSGQQNLPGNSNSGGNGDPSTDVQGHVVQSQNYEAEESIQTLTSRYESMQTSAHTSLSDSGLDYAPVQMSQSQVVDPLGQTIRPLNASLESSPYMYVPSQKARNSGIKVRLIAEVKETLQELNKGGVQFEGHPFTPPAGHTEQLYDQLAKNKCLEVPLSSLVKSKRCGSGYFGDVFKGVWETPYGPKDVAIKMLKPGTSQSQKVKFLQEAALMAQFKHPNIVRLFGAVTLEEPNILLLEYLHNGDLLRYLENQKQMLQTKRVVNLVFKKQLLRFCGEIAEGMRYLSRRGFVHRDLAARNILLSNDFKCKIADFGMSKELNQEDYYVSSGGRIPVKWTAPEAVFYKKYSPGCDVWSYGMVMFEIWSLGEKPFPNLTVNEVIQTFAKKKGYVQPPPPGCPRAIYRLMVFCWNYDHHSRPNFGEIVNQLSESPEFILDIPEASLLGLPDPTRARMLGAPLECARDMYYDLQQLYRKKENH